MFIALTAIGIACIVYGLSIMMAASGSWFFVFWYVVGALLLAAGWLVRSGAWSAIPPVGRWAAIAVAVVLAIAFAVSQVVIASDFDDRGEPDLDCIVVLGAQVRQNGLSVALRSRLDTAYDYLMENERTICIVSGGKGANEPIAEADAMGNYLESRGIDPKRIIREDRSINTVQNIENSMQLYDLEKTRVGIVSNSYHLFRALAIARKHGIAHVCGISAGATPWYLPNNAAREAFGIAKDFLEGNL